MITVGMVQCARIHEIMVRVSHSRTFSLLRMPTTRRKIASPLFSNIDVDKRPPCVSERVTFMCPDKLQRETKHPYSDSHEDYKHYRKTFINLPPYSSAIVPFRWMMRNTNTYQSEIADLNGVKYDPSKEPDLGFPSRWAQFHENQRELLDTFISAIQPEESLIFFYAKHVPLSEAANRILIGVGHVKSIFPVQEYDCEPKIPGKQSYIWERVVEHSIRGNWKNGFTGGFILPYQELLDLQGNGKEIDLESFIAPASNWDEFSYGAEHVSHSTAIDALHTLANTLKKMEQPLGRSFDTQYKWIDDRISELWKMRGAFPGIGPVLTAFGLKEGNFIAWEISKKIENEQPEPELFDSWLVVEQMFNNPGSVLPAHLAKKVGSVVRAAWKGLDPDTKEYFILLSRLELNNEQADAFFDADNRIKNGFEAHTTKEYLENPYLLFEASTGCQTQVTLSMVDKAVIPADSIRQALPLPELSAIDDPLDGRRLRAVIIQVMEDAAIEGHSLLPEYLLIERSNALTLEPKISIKTHILQAIKKYLNPKVQVTEATEELPKFYQLLRLIEIKKVIQDFVEKRHTKGQSLIIEADWQELVNQKLGPIDQKLPEYIKANEKKARTEKTVALGELAKGRFL